MSEIISPHAYRLDLPASMRVHDVFHVSLLNPVSTDPMPSQHSQPPPPVVVDEEDEYLVEAILDSRVRRQKLEFFIKWSGYETPTWDPLSCVNDSVALNPFIALHPDKPRPAE